MQEYYLMILSQPRQHNRASGYLRGPVSELDTQDQNAAADTVKADRQQSTQGDHKASKKQSKSMLPAVKPRMVQFKESVSELGNKVLTHSNCGASPGLLHHAIQRVWCHTTVIGKMTLSDILLCILQSMSVMYHYLMQ